MRILHIYTGNLFGGIERMLLSLASLPDGKASHSFALCFEGKLSSALRDRGASLYLLPQARIRRPFSVLKTRSALSRLLTKKKFDHVICHSIWSYCVFSSAAATAGYSTILYLHDLPTPDALYYRWASLFPPTLCIANSNYVAAAAADLSVRTRVEVVHPLVPAPRRVPRDRAVAVRETVMASSSEVVVLQASRFEPWKGHRTLISALRAISGVPGWVCWIAGEPQRQDEMTYQKDLLERVNACGLDGRVRFIGHRDDIDVVLTACDVYCQPNEKPEPFGMVLVEAMFAAKPVVTSASGGPLDIVTDNCGFLCGEGPTPVATALEKLVLNEKLRTQMGEGGAVRAREICGEERFNDRLLEVLPC